MAWYPVDCCCTTVERKEDPGTRFCTMGLQSHFMALVIHGIFRVYSTHFRGIIAPQCNF